MVNVELELWQVIIIPIVLWCMLMGLYFLGYMVGAKEGWLNRIKYENDTGMN